MPRTIIQENKGLKETLNVLYAVIDIYKQAEVYAEDKRILNVVKIEMTTSTKLPTNPFSIVMILHEQVNLREY